MSWEEAKIREELEMDVERELEEEIKEGICHLAFRLQRLYQQQKQRNARGATKNSSKILSEVNISIKLEGGTKIEIKEIKKRQSSRENLVIGITPRVDYQMAHVQRILGCPPPHRKKFDWANSLRSTEPSAKYADSSTRHFSRMNKSNASKRHQ